MNFPRAVRAAAAIAVGIAAGAAAWRGLVPIEPFLEVTVKFEFRTENYETWDVTTKVRGAETLDEIRVEPVSGPIEVTTPVRKGIGSGLSTTFRVRANGQRPPNCVVRVVQTGRVSRTYEMPLEETP